MVYLFLGQDSISKDIRLKTIKKEFLSRGTEQFNCDTLYAKELTLKDLQEKLLCIPVKSQKRIVVIKDARNLTEEIKGFIFNYVKKPYKEIILILDIGEQAKPEELLNRIHRYVKVYRFQEVKQIDTFTLSRSITLKNPDYALRLLNQLLKQGERPERILGGLRYTWEREVSSSQEARRKLKLLLNCDIDIKTGKLNPVFALEKLVVSLCSFGKPFH